MSPKLLKEHQEWFGEMITRPLGSAFEDGGYLEDPQRITVYNQQYWWRLQKNLKEAFPLTASFFGEHAFDKQLCTPFLQKYPPNHFSLDYLGERFPQFIEEEYSEEDRSLVLDAARIDWALHHSFFAAKYSLQGLDEALFEKPLFLQPHLHLFALNYDLFSFRQQLFAKENSIPELERGSLFFAVWRDRKNNVVWEAIDEAEYRTLLLFREGATLDAICDHLANQRDPAIQERLQVWLQDWIVTEWLSIKFLK